MGAACLVPLHWARSSFPFLARRFFPRFSERFFDIAKHYRAVCCLEIYPRVPSSLIHPGRARSLIRFLRPEMPSLASSRFIHEFEFLDYRRAIIYFNHVIRITILEYGTRETLPSFPRGFKRESIPSMLSTRDDNARRQWADLKSDINARYKKTRDGKQRADTAHRILQIQRVGALFPLYRAVTMGDKLHACSPGNTSLGRRTEPTLYCRCITALCVYIYVDLRARLNISSRYARTMPLIRDCCWCGY